MPAVIKSIIKWAWAILIVAFLFGLFFGGFYLLMAHREDRKGIFNFFTLIGYIVVYVGVGYYIQKYIEKNWTKKKN